jgi:hypothetical protein
MPRTGAVLIWICRLDANLCVDLRCMIGAVPPLQARYVPLAPVGAPVGRAPTVWLCPRHAGTLRWWTSRLLEPIAPGHRDVSLRGEKTL